MTDAEPTDDGSAFNRWLVLVAVAVILVVSLIAYFAHWHWLSSLWFGYAWPSDKGNGPEAIQQTIIYALLAVIFIPPVRRFFTAKFHKVHTKLDAHHEAVAARQDHIIRQNAHLIEHSATPNVTHDGVDLTVHPITGTKLTHPSPTAPARPARKSVPRKATARKDPPK